MANKLLTRDEAGKMLLRGFNKATKGLTKKQKLRVLYELSKMYFTINSLGA